MAASQTLAAGTWRDFATALFEAAGLPPASAAQVAEVLVWADRRGTASHGLSRVRRYLEMLASGEMALAAAPRLRQHMGGCFVLEAGRAAGPAAMMQAAGHAMELAAAAGVSFGLVADTTHVGAAGCYAQRLAENGYVGIVGAAGVPNMAYHGGRTPALSTSPLAIGIPAHGAPLLLDMATSVVALGRLRQAKAAGETLPPGWALTRDGLPTTDPALAEIPLPLGGPKGSGLALMLECLCGVLSGAPILAAMLQPGAARRHSQNALVIAIAVEAFQPLAAFKDAVAALTDAIHALPAQDGGAALLLPGERGNRLAQRRDDEGVPVSAKTWRSLADAAARLGVKLPQAAVPLQ